MLSRRYRLQKRDQLPGETIDTYDAALRELRLTCTFGGFTD